MSSFEFDSTKTYTILIPSPPLNKLLPQSVLPGSENNFFNIELRAGNTMGRIVGTGGTYPTSGEYFGLSALNYTTQIRWSGILEMTPTVLPTMIEIVISSEGQLPEPSMAVWIPTTLSTVDVPLTQRGLPLQTTLRQICLR